MEALEYHIVNGDHLKEFLPQNDRVYPFREALIEGDSSYDLDELETFFQKRADYFKTLFPDENYNEKVVSEFLNMNQIPSEATVYFWFGNDDFCLRNLAFLLDVFQDKNWIKKRVLPDNKTCEDFFQKIDFRENSEMIKSKPS